MEIKEPFTTHGLAGEQTGSPFGRAAPGGRGLHRLSDPAGGRDQGDCTLPSHDVSPAMKSVAPPLITPDPVTVEEPAVSQSRDNAPRRLQLTRFLKPNRRPSSTRSRSMTGSSTTENSREQSQRRPRSPHLPQMLRCRRSRESRSRRASRHQKTSSLTGWINFQKTALKKSCVGFGRTLLLGLRRASAPAPSGHGWREGGCILKKIFPRKKRTIKTDGLDGIRTRGLHVANVTIYP